MTARRRGRWGVGRLLVLTVCALAALVVTAGLLGVLPGTGQVDRPEAGGASASPSPSVPSEAPTEVGTPTTTPPSSPAPSAAAEEVLTVAVPAVGLSSQVRTISPEGGVIDPPTFGEAYVIAPYGRPGGDNTTYIAGHSWARGDAVFNPLLDVASQQSALQPGDTVVVTTAGATWTYEVTGTRRYPKGELAEADDVWAKVPGRLVLITCFQRNDGAASRDNLVVTADLVGQAPPAEA